MSENKLGSMPITKLVLNMSLPIMTSMLIQALYNFVDSYFVAQIGENAEQAITALSIALPLQGIIIAFAVGTGIGLNAVLARNLGKKDFNSVSLTATNGLLLAVLMSILFAFLGLFTVQWYYKAQVDNPIVIEYGVQYLRIIVSCAGVKIFAIFLERMLQATGKASLSMISQSSSALLNIILDPIFIFSLDMGIKGAAIATILAQCIGLLLALHFNIHYNKDIHLEKKHMSFDASIIKDIFEIGIPAIIMQAIQSFMIFGLNAILLTISETALTAYGLYFRIQQLIFMPVFGINNALMPIISYNFGAQKNNRIRKSIRVSLIFGGIIMSIGIIIFQLIPDLIIDLFNPSPELRFLAIRCLKITSLSYLFVNTTLLLQSGMQSLREAHKALTLTILRTIGILLPTAFFLSKTANPNLMVWWAQVISEGITMIVTIPLFLRILKKKGL